METPPCRVIRAHEKATGGHQRSNALQRKPVTTLPTGRNARPPPLGVRYPLKVDSRTLSQLWVLQSRSAVGPFLGHADFTPSNATPTRSRRCQLTPGFTLLQRHSHRNLVLPAEASRTPLVGFRSLQHMRSRRSTRRGGAATRYVPPPGFGYPLDGLLPPRPCRPCFVSAALLGLHPSELPPPAR